MLQEPLHQGPIVVKKSPIHGYGVFAVEDIEANLIIEECYTLFANANIPEFNDYFFMTNKARAAFPLGYGCIYNHSNKPNVDYSYDPESGLLVFFTIQAVRQGEELCTSYGANWFSSRKLKPRIFSGWRQAYSLAKGLPLRALIACCGCLAIIQGIKYLAS